VSTVPVATLSDLGRLSRTVIQLRPGQVGQRMRLCTQRMVLDYSVPLLGRWLLSGSGRLQGTAWRDEVGWPCEFIPLDSVLWCGGRVTAEWRAGKPRLIGTSLAIAPVGDDGTAQWSRADWAAAGAPLLWRFHLYYWDWAWALARGHPDDRALFAEIWKSWHAAVVPGRGPAWHPYPAALRAWSFCGIYRALVRGSQIEDAFCGELATLTGFLRRNLEKDVGGNHLIKNLKALAGLALFFDDEALLTRALSQLARQIRIQVLPDGGHYERAPAYHCQVLGDLIDIADLLRAAGRTEPAGLAEATTAMRGWLGALLAPSGDVPMLNDGFPIEPRLREYLAAAAPPADPLHVLPDTGLARAAAGGWLVFADVGPPCPRELPAHAHADTLSCLVYLDGEPLLVDTGTSTYAPGAKRDYERSTAAHNTLEVDRRNSTEVWGAFRAGRRARVLGVTAREEAGTVTVEAAHDGYRSLPGRPVHRRRWSVDPRELRVDDTVSGQGRHQVTVRWYLAPGTGLQLVRRGAVVSTTAGEVEVTISASSALTVRACAAPVSAGFGKTVTAPVLVCTLYPELPAQVSTVWRRAQTPEEPV
jgi:uncharacterized heparinase superfamily protein